MSQRVDNDGTCYQCGGETEWMSGVQICLDCSADVENCLCDEDTDNGQNEFEDD